MIISIIVAVSQNNVIGKKGEILWHIPGDLPRFKRLTMGHCIVMGRKTFESIGKVLPGRTNIIITRQKDFHVLGATIIHSPKEAIKIAKKGKEAELFIIGGGEIYKHFLPITDKLYLTKVFKNYKGDAFFPKIKISNWKLLSKEDGVSEKDKLSYEYLILQRRKDKN